MSTTESRYRQHFLPPLNVFHNSLVTVTDPDTLTPGTKSKFYQIQLNHLEYRHRSRAKTRHNEMRQDLNRLKLAFDRVSCK